MNIIKLSAISILCCIMVACSTNANKDDELSLYRVFVGDKYGFMDDKGKIVIEPQFDEAFHQFSEGVCFARIGDKKGLIDESGQFILEYADSVKAITNFVNGLARVTTINNNQGIVSKDGKLIIPAIYYHTSVHEDGENTYILVEGDDDNRDWFVADNKGVKVFEPCDSILAGFDNGLCPVKIDGKWGYVNQDGRFAIDLKFDYARLFTDEGIARVRIGQEEFFIDKSGKRLFTVDKTLTGFTCNRAIVIKNGQKCMIDHLGNVICPIDWEKVWSFSTVDGLALVSKGEKSARIDTMGNVVISGRYESIGAFSDGLASVKVDGKYGYVDNQGNEVVSVTNQSSFSVLEGGKRLLAMENWIDGVWAISYYDLKGNLIWKDAPKIPKVLPYRPTRQDFIEYFDDHMSELDPIEGIYYVTNKSYYQNRNNSSDIGLNNTNSKFYAIVWDQYIDGFEAYAVDDIGMHWVNKFVRIGETNSYAILKIDKDSKYSSEGKVTIDNPAQFEFKLEQDHNNYYNFFVTYEFVRDYPPMSEYERMQQTEWSGTGFAITDGYIATNYHVTNGAKTIRIKGVKGDMTESYNGCVVASDKEHDLSIIKIVDKDFEGFGSIPYKVGKSNVDVGDDVFVLGYPMTSTMGEEVKLTDGIISSSTGFKGDESMYQMTAAVQPGNSGGPLFNSEGSVIGIVCAKHADAENANYAVKVSYLYGLITESELGINMGGSNVRRKGLSNKVKKLKDFVYLIECSSK